ncbi:MAG: class I SAM-dependent methyltransferase, partial [Pirellula sp.]
TIAPWVEQVIAVDSSTAMLQAARKRLREIDNVDLRKGELTSLPIDDDTLTTAMLVLVLPYLTAPQQVFAEARRVTKRHGRLIILDMMPHDRAEYRDELGHSWMGFSKEHIASWLTESGWTMERWMVLPPDPEAKGTQIFVTSASRSV